MHHIGETNFRDDGNPVPLTLAKVSTLVSQIGEGIVGELFLRKFGLLHAQHIGLHFFYPGLHTGQASL